jgi:hypothetical protein
LNEDKLNEFDAHCCQSSVDRVSGEVSLALVVLRVADTDVAIDIQHSCLSARRLDSRNEVEAVAVGVVVSIDGADEVRSRGGLDELSLEVVQRRLRCGNLAVKLVVAALDRKSQSA